VTGLCFWTFGETAFSVIITKRSAPLSATGSYGLPLLSRRSLVFVEYFDPSGDFASMILRINTLLKIWTPDITDTDITDTDITDIRDKTDINENVRQSSMKYLTDFDRI